MPFTRAWTLGLPQCLPTFWLTCHTWPNLRAPRASSSPQSQDPQSPPVSAHTLSKQDFESKVYAVTGGVLALWLPL